VVELIRAERFDVVHVHAFDAPAVEATGALEIPVIHTVHLPPDRAVLRALAEASTGPPPSGRAGHAAKFEVVTRPLHSHRRVRLLAIQGGVEIRTARQEQPVHRGQGGRAVRIARSWVESNRIPASAAHGVEIGVERGPGRLLASLPAPGRAG